MCERICETRRVGRSLTLTVFLAVLCAASIPSLGLGARPGWTQYTPLHLPVTVGLPLSWSISGSPPQGTRFYATVPPGGIDYVELLYSSYAGRASDFVSTMSARARQYYLTQDPKASIRSRTITLPGGKAFEVITSLIRTNGSRSYPLSIDDYSFLHGGHVYEFLYLCETPKVGVYFPVFSQSARTIRFTS